MKYLLLLFSAFAFAQAPNEMVSFTQASTLGFALNAGQSHVTSNRCMTKDEALTKYRLSKGALAAYANNQLIPRVDWWSDCTVRVSATVYKTFMCHNLGATESLDPHVPVEGIHGNYYQWGKATAVATSSTPAGAISGWSNTAGVSWADNSKTAQDPCPTGFRVPTAADWVNVFANNTRSTIGTFGSSSTNFGCAIHFGTPKDSKALTLPIAGIRASPNGALDSRGATGWYTSSTEENAGAARFVQIFEGFSNATGNTTKSNGLSLRCISQ